MTAATLLLWLLQVTPELAPPPRPYDATLSRVVRPRTEAALKGHPEAGLVVGVWDRGVKKVYGFGTVDTPVGRHVPNADTLFEIGSITKTFTGLLLAEAVRNGEVRLSDAVSEHLPRHLRVNGAIVSPTLEQLATHHSGFPVEPPLIGLMARRASNPYADFTTDKLSRLLGVLKPSKPPGAAYVYSNLCAGLVGHALVHRGRAANFEELIRKRITYGLDMPSTGESLTGAQRARLARGHSGGQPTDPWDFASLEGCGALRSSANDLLTYAAAHFGGAPPGLGRSMKLATTPLADTDGGRTRVGLFWHVTARPGKPTLVWHNGGTGGYRAMLVIVPASRIAVVSLCSSADCGDGVDRVALEAAAELAK